MTIVIPPKKSRNIYFKKLKEKKLWKDHLQKAMGVTNVLDYYKLEEIIGKGQFSLVKLGTQLKTGLKVAVKQVKKKNMNLVETFQQRREIEVLKMC